MNLKEFRKQKNLTQIEMAKILDLNQQAYSRLENSDSILSIKNALKISQYFGISLDEIYGIVSPEERQQGIVDFLPVHINTLQSKLLDIFDEIGERLGENGQKAYIGIGESIIQNITK